MIRPLYFFPLLLCMILGCIGSWRLGKQRAQQNERLLILSNRNIHSLITEAEPAPLTQEQLEAEQVAKLKKLGLRLENMSEDISQGHDIFLVFHEIALVADDLLEIPDPIWEKAYENLPADQRQQSLMSFKMLASLFASENSQKSRAESAFEKAISQPKMNPGLVNTALMAWLMAEPQAVQRRLLQELQSPNPAAWARTRYGVFHGVEKSEFSNTFNQITQIPDSKERSYVMREIGFSVSGYFSGEKKSWDTTAEPLLKNFLTHPKFESPENRSEVLGRVIKQRLKFETPQEAMAWVETLNLPKDSQPWVQQAIFDGWGSKDLAAAANWMLEKTPEEARSNMVNQVITQWTHANVIDVQIRRQAAEPDLAAAAEWLLTQAPADTDAAKATFAQSCLFYGKTQDALQWSEAITDPQLREKTTSQVKQKIEGKAAR